MVVGSLSQIVCFACVFYDGTEHTLQIIQDILTVTGYVRPYFPSRTFGCFEWCTCL